MRLGLRPGSAANASRLRAQLQHRRYPAASVDRGQPGERRVLGRGGVRRTTSVCAAAPCEVAPRAGGLRGDGRADARWSSSAGGPDRRAAAKRASGDPAPAQDARWSRPPRIVRLQRPRRQYSASARERPEGGDATSAAWADPGWPPTIAAAVRDRPLAGLARAADEAQGRLRLGGRGALQLATGGRAGGGHGRAGGRAGAAGPAGRASPGRRRGAARSARTSSTSAAVSSPASWAERAAW